MGNCSSSRVVKNITKNENINDNENEYKYKKERVHGIHHVITSDGFLDYHKQVHISMFDENRKKVIILMKKINNKNQQNKLNKNLINSVLLFQGGKDFHRYDTDVDFIFKQESFFAYLFGINEPNFYGAIDMNTEESILFIPELPENMAVWIGPNKTKEFYKNKYGVDHVDYTHNIKTYLLNKNIKSVYLPKGINMYSNRENEPVVFDGMGSFKLNYTLLMDALCEARVIKSEKELNLMRFVNKISSEAHIDVMKNANLCTYERELESHFLHYINKNYGCRHVSYGCICCSGHNGAVLHYGHAGSPNDKIINKDMNEMLLLDMGAEYHNYGSDITCSFPISGKFTENQKLIYNAVLDAQLAVEKHVKKGVSWNYLQKTADIVLLEHLINMNLVFHNGVSIDNLIDIYKISKIFMPHGFGHLLGLDVHDVDSSIFREYSDNKNNEDNKNRKDSLLRKGMVITVEPGIYFNESILLPAFKNNDINKFLNVEKILSEFMNFGGIRLEDDVIVLDDSCEVITKVPRTIEEIENVMN